LQALIVAIAALVVIVAGAWGGVYRSRVLPKHHLDSETREAVRIGVGLIATMAALVLGLLLASAKSSYDTKSQEIRTGAAKIILLDRTLREYGSDAVGVRTLLRDLVEHRLHRGWVDTRNLTVVEPDAAGEPLPFERVQEQLRALSPVTPAQRFAQARWLLVEQIGGSIPIPFLVLLVLWVALIFASLGLFAPSNGTFHATIILCALSVSSALFLIIEMDRRFGGLLRISDAPMRSANFYLQR